MAEMLAKEFLGGGHIIQYSIHKWIAQVVYKTKCMNYLLVR